jgi:hypothetical protein
MPPTTPVWPGWIGTALANAATYRLSWAEWCACQRQLAQQQAPHYAARAPRRDDVAARAFLAWFDAAAAGNAGHAPPQGDRELAVRGYMRRYQEVAATLDPFSGPELARLRLLRQRHHAG